MNSFWQDKYIIGRFPTATKVTYVTYIIQIEKREVFFIIKLPKSPAQLPKNVAFKKV